MLPDAVFQQGDVHHAVGFGHADAFAKIANGFRGVAPSPQARYRRHARIVPAVDVAFFDQADQLALAEHRVVEVETRKLDLLGMVDFQLVQNPVIELAIDFKFQRTDRMGDPFDRIREAVGKVIHGINHPHTGGAIMGDFLDPIQGGIAHQHIGRCHVDFGSEHMVAFIIFTGPHAFEHIQIFFNRALTIGAVFTGLCQGAAIFPDLIGAEAVNIGLAFFDELNGIFK